MKTTILELLPEAEKEKLIEEVAKLIEERTRKLKEKETASKETIENIVNNIV